MAPENRVTNTQQHPRKPASESDPPCLTRILQRKCRVGSKALCTAAADPPAVGASPAWAVKIGVVDLSRALNESEAGIRSRNVLEARGRQKQKEFQEVKNEKKEEVAKDAVMANQEKEESEQIPSAEAQDEARRQKDHPQRA